MHDHIIRLPEVSERVGLRKSAIYDAIARDKFPRPVRITSKAVGWRTSEIDAWISALSPTHRNRR